MRVVVLSIVLISCGAPAPTDSTGSAHAAEAGSLTLTTPSFTLAPGGEALKCYFTSLPSNQAVSITRIDSAMGKGGHHALLFLSSIPNQPDGTLRDCDIQLGGGVTPNAVPIPFLLTQHESDSFVMPSGVAMDLEARQPLMIEMHYLNTTTAPIDASVTITATLTDEKLERAGLFASYNKKIAVPPHGTQTVDGHCVPPAGARFFRMTTHAHRLMTSAGVDRWKNGQVGEELVHSEDWENPTVRDFAAPYLTFAPGEELYYTCSYRNPGDAVVYEGQSVVTSEMCMAVGYYFPSAGAAVCYDSKTLPLE